MARGTGLTKMNTTFLVVWLGLIHKRPSYRPTGTQPSPRSVSVWRSVTRSTSLSSARPLTRCTHWLQTGTTAPPHWVVTSGKRWVVQRPPCSPTATRKGSMFNVVVANQESASLETTRTVAFLVILRSGLVISWISTATHVEIEGPSKPWDTS